MRLVREVRSAGGVAGLGILQQIAQKEGKEVKGVRSEVRVKVFPRVVSNVVKEKGILLVREWEVERPERGKVRVLLGCGITTLVRADTKGFAGGAARLATRQMSVRP